MGKGVGGVDLESEGRSVEWTILREQCAVFSWCSSKQCQDWGDCKKNGINNSAIITKKKRWYQYIS